MSSHTDSVKTKTLISWDEFLCTMFIKICVFFFNYSFSDVSVSSSTICMCGSPDVPLGLETDKKACGRSQRITTLIFILYVFSLFVK
jgi:hypothetical protein